MASTTAIASSSRKKQSHIQNGPPKSGEKIVDSDEGVSEDDETEDDSDSIDSDGDIEAVTSKKKQTKDLSARKSSGKSFPKYAPPSGMQLVDIDTSFKDSPFEYSRLANNPRLQLWTIRAPLDFKPSRLSSLTFSIPKNGQAPRGTLKQKNSSFSLVPAAELTKAKLVVDEEGRQPTAGASAADSTDLALSQGQLEGGEEMSGGMRLLVPDINREGKLFVAPRPISQRLLLVPDVGEEVSAENDHLPAFLPGSVAPAVLDTDTALAKRVQPEHLLKFRNRAFGFDTPGPYATQLQSSNTKSPVKPIPAVSDSKKQKRKTDVQEGQTPSKKKKVKA